VSEARQLTERTAKRLERLYVRRQRLERECVQAADELALHTQRASDLEGATRAEIAALLGVGTSTVQGWVERGRQLEAKRGSSLV